ncbi:MAG: Ig-like domain repeat protein, partial [Planctomycetes bacterium]|nr:Ig-like domain repeat protein [Planctomycetota bacterium]
MAYDGFLTNCIAFNNTGGWGPFATFPEIGYIYVDYSCIEGGFPGRGNISETPRFRDGISGTWNANALCGEYGASTTFYTLGTNWSNDIFAEQFLIPNNVIDKIYHISSNSGNSITVRGNAFFESASGINFEIRDLRLSHDSPCIDAGNSVGVGSSLDFLGNPSKDHPQVANSGYGTTTYYDMGAFEVQDSGLYAGTDQYITQTNTLLEGQAELIGDWVLEGNLWTVLEQTGSLIISDNTLLTPDATFSAEGSYRLQFSGNYSSATYGNLTLNDNVVIIYDITDPVVDAGANIFTTQDATLSGSASDPLAGIATILWEKISGSGSFTFDSPTSLSTAIHAYSDSIFTLRLTATDRCGNFASDEMTVTVDNGTPLVEAGVTLYARAAVSPVASASDAVSGIASYEWQQSAGPGNVSITNGNTLSPSFTASAEGTYTLILYTTDRAGNGASDSLSLIWDLTPPIVTPGANISARVPRTLSGAASDLASPIASTTWSQISGLGTVNFADAAALNTSFSADTDGVYLLRLSAQARAGNRGNAELTLIWDTTGPVCSAGSDVSTATPVLLTGSVSDALSSVGNVSWTQTAGPGTATIFTPGALSTFVQASAQGSYTLRFSAQDSLGNSSSDTMTFTWDTVDPVVEAGATRYLNSAASLAGSAADATSGLLATLWSKAIGEGNVSF